MYELQLGFDANCNLYVVDDVVAGESKYCTKTLFTISAVDPPVER